MAINWSEPARRHRCEECNEIFECHLCTIRFCHPVHQGLHNGRRAVYVCESCVKEHGPRHITTYNGHIKGYVIIRKYDHLTGKILQRSKHKVFARSGTPRPEWKDKREREAAEQSRSK